MNSVLGGLKILTSPFIRTIISCNYEPPGNYVNQRPYLRVIQELFFFFFWVGAK